eukprot:1177920-Prorocentrum_minimum.AAC.4
MKPGQSQPVTRRLYRSLLLLNKTEIRVARPLVLGRDVPVSVETDARRVRERVCDGSAAAASGPVDEHPRGQQAALLLAPPHAAAAAHRHRHLTAAVLHPGLRLGRHVFLGHVGDPAGGHTPRSFYPIIRSVLKRVINSLYASKSLYSTL